MSDPGLGAADGGPTSGGPTSGGPTSGGPTSGGPTSGGPTSGGPTSGGPTSGGPTSGGPTSGGPTSGGPTSGADTASGSGLSPGEAAVLRKIATDSAFRTLFATDPIAAITGADLKVTTLDYNRLERLGPAQLEQVAAGINALSGAGAMASGLQAEGTNTLLYAIIVAVLLAEE